MNELDAAKILDDELDDDFEEEGTGKKRKTRALNILCYFDETTRVVADSKCFALQKHASTSAEGVDLWVSRWYYTDLRSLLKEYLKKELRGVRLTKKVKPHIEDLIEVISKFEERLISMENLIKEKLPVIEEVNEG